VAHDFNNMLGVIIGHTEMLLEQVPRESALRGDLEEIQRAAHRSADLTRQLLAFARKQTVAPQVLDLNVTIEGTLKLLRRLIGEGIDLVWRPAEDPAPVRMDPSQVDQVLANLCLNARDAIANVGTITIETRFATFDAAYCAEHPGYLPGDYQMLAVTDDGCGIDEAALEHLFEPFFTTKGVGKGTGLGLATVYGIVNQNDGFIKVDTKPCRGTTFAIYLPRHAAEAPLPPERRTQGPKRGDETILLVEDEPSVLRLGSLLLESLGYVVLVADTPEEALRVAREHHGTIDLLVTDVVMPGMSGRDLGERMHSLRPDLKRLFTSGYTADVIGHRGVLDEGVNFLAKPFSKEQLAAKVREALER
jgi:two-component system, cell cycle sensor histidine kinase and response regulator CckA